MGWYDYSWVFRQPITVTNKASDYQSRATIGYNAGVINCGGHCNTDFSDLRFTSSDGITLVPYWVETKTDSNSALIWIKNDNSDTLYMYYGNTGVASTSNASDTWTYWFDWSTDETAGFSKKTGGTNNRAYAYTMSIPAFTLSTGIRVLAKTSMSSVILSANDVTVYFGFLVTADDYTDSADNFRVQMNVDTGWAPQDYMHRIICEDGGVAKYGNYANDYAPTLDQYDVWEFLGISPSFLKHSIYTNNSDGVLLVSSTTLGGVPADNMGFVGYGGDAETNETPTDFWGYDAANDAIEWGSFYNGRATIKFKNKWFCIGKYASPEQFFSFGAEEANPNFFVFTGASYAFYIPKCNITSLSLNDSQDIKTYNFWDILDVETIALGLQTKNITIEGVATTSPYTTMAGIESAAEAGDIITLSGMKNTVLNTTWLIESFSYKPLPVGAVQWTLVLEKYY